METAFIYWHMSVYRTIYLQFSDGMDFAGYAYFMVIRLLANIYNRSIIDRYICSQTKKIIYIQRDLYEH